MPPKKFYYAVKIGQKPGIYDTWEEAQKQIKGFSNANYKKFNSIEEAQKYLEISDNVLNKEKDKFKAVAYVDGSFNNKKNIFTYGLVFFYDNKKIEVCEKFKDNKWIKINNVAGEIMGAIKAMQIAASNNIDSLLIYHDFEGIKKWCTGEWKAKNFSTLAYKKFYEEISRNIKIGFKWVKGHSNNMFNDRADALARLAYDLNKISPLLIDPITIYIDKEEIENILEKCLKKYKNYEILEKQETQNYKEFKLKINNKELIITFNYKWAGDISIQYQGDNVGYEIKKDIETNYAIKDNVQNNWLSFKADITTIENLLEKLKKIEGIKINKIDKTEKNIFAIYGIEYGTNFLKCKIFNNSRVLLQGKSSILFSTLITFLNELEIINTEKLIELSNNAFELRNKEIDILTELMNKMPISFDKIHPHIKQNLCTSLILLKTIESHFEYSWVTFPALKSLEGTLKLILLDYNIIVENKGGNFGQVFELDKKSNKYKLKSKHKNIINHGKLICNMYDFINKYRHTTFHHDQIIENSKRIETMEEAKEITYSSMKLIEDYYKETIIK